MHWVSKSSCRRSRKNPWMSGHIYHVALLFIPRPWSRGGDIVITMSGRASVFRSRTIYLKPLAGLLSYCIHTSLRGCRCAFLGVMTFDLVFDLWFWGPGDYRLWLIADNKFSFQSISRKAEFFHTAHTNPSGGVDVPFGGYDLWPNFYPPPVGEGGF